MMKYTSTQLLTKKSCCVPAMTKYSEHLEETEIFSIDGVRETQFVLAVQEANFLYSFTLSAFTAMNTSLTMC